MVAYSKRGKAHYINVEYDRHMLSYVVYVDGKLYSRADSRAEANEDAGDVVRCKGWTLNKPATNKNTPPVPASN